MTWTPDLHYQKTIGDYTLTPERMAGETAYLVGFPDGTRLRCLPDPRNSAKYRSLVISRVLKELSEVQDNRFVTLNPVSYLIGVLTETGLAWERVATDVDFEPWLADWIITHQALLLIDDEAGVPSARRLITDAGKAGFEFRRTE